MTKVKDLVLERNQKMTTAAVFLQTYNQSIPTGFPRATLADLKQFEIIHSRLFKNRGEWSMEKHRKRLMDWLPAYRNKHQA